MSFGQALVFIVILAVLIYGVHFGPFFTPGPKWVLKALLALLIVIVLLDFFNVLGDAKHLMGKHWV